MVCSCGFEDGPIKRVRKIQRLHVQSRLMEFCASLSMLLSLKLLVEAQSTE